MIEKDLLYTKEHEWVKITGNTAVLGITYHAQELLGDVTFVELPEVGTDLAQNDPVSVIESSKAASDVYSPLSGTITEVNAPLDSQPELVNESCYKDGWICKLEIKDPAEATSLMTADQYEKFLKTEEQ
ncbi:MAG: glycine cleavage system protein GcvH [Phycisphaeraceae bacterium]|nr:glycine cleavage system protein GcvH [Phycisphaeraceae bacterium]